MTAPDFHGPLARQAAVNAAAAYEPRAAGVLAGNPGYLLSVMLETARRAVEAAAPHLRASEREQCARLADQAGEGHSYGTMSVDVLRDLAAAIRSGDTP